MMPNRRHGRGGPASRSRSLGRRGRDGRRGLPPPGGATLRPAPNASLRENRGGPAPNASLRENRGGRERSWSRGGVPATRAKASSAGPSESPYPFVAFKAAPPRR
jgi:hypothetical protein